MSPTRTQHVSNRTQHRFKRMRVVLHGVNAASGRTVDFSQSLQTDVVQVWVHRRLSTQSAHRHRVVFIQRHELPRSTPGTTDGDPHAETRALASNKHKYRSANLEQNGVNSTVRVGGHKHGQPAGDQATYNERNRCCLSSAWHPQQTRVIFRLQHLQHRGLLRQMTGR
jgi:hypothetical protein